MSKNKLIKIDTDLVIKDSRDIDTLLKPFQEEILLFTTKISNTYKIKNTLPLLSLKVKDQLFFKLGKSKYEDNLIEIYTSKNELIGYVPEADSIIFARLMGAGKRLGATVKSISETRSIPLIEIDIYLIDF